MRQNFVIEALRRLDSVPVSNETRPALLIVDDCNLQLVQGQDVVQRIAPPGLPDPAVACPVGAMPVAWQVCSTPNGLVGDLAFVKGAAAVAIDLDMGSKASMLCR